MNFMLLKFVTNFYQRIKSLYEINLMELSDADESPNKKLDKDNTYLKLAGELAKCGCDPLS